MSFESYLMDAVNLVLDQEYSDVLDDAALSDAVVCMTNYLVHIAQD